MSVCYGRESSEMSNGHYLYEFNSSEETCAPFNQTRAAVTPGRTLTEFGESSSTRPDCVTTRWVKELMYLGKS